METLQVHKDDNNNDAFTIEMKEIEDDENKIIEKIEIQKEEIEKTKILLTQIENCYEAQEQRLNQFFTKQLEIKNRKLKLLNSYDNCSNNFVDLTNINENDSNQLIGESVKLIQNHDLKRKYADNEDIKAKEIRMNEKHLEGERAELKNLSETVNKGCYEQNFLYKIPNNVTINKISITKNIIYICGSKGFLGERYKQIASVKRIFTKTNESIIDILRIKDNIYAFTLNTMILIIPRISPSIIKIFQSSISGSVQLRGYMIFIPLQDGTVWQYDYRTNSMKEFYQSPSIFTGFICIKHELYILLINQTVIEQHQHSARTLVVDGCKNINISSDTNLICTLEKKILIINVQSGWTIFERHFDDYIKLVKSSKLILVVLDSKNKLHIFKIKVNHEYEDFIVIQLPVEHNINTILATSTNEVLISTNTTIYEIKF